MVGELYFQFRADRRLSLGGVGGSTLPIPGGCSSAQVSEGCFCHKGLNDCRREFDNVSQGG